MVTVMDMEKTIKTLCENINENIEKLRKIFGSLDYRDQISGETLLHIVCKVKENYKCISAITALLSAGVDPNIKDNNGQTFVQTAFKNGYSEKLMIAIVLITCKYNFDVNTLDDEYKTILHTAIYSENYAGKIINLYKIIVNEGFDSKTIDIHGRNLYEAMVYEKKYAAPELYEFKKEFEKNIDKQMNQPKKEVNIDAFLNIINSNKFYNLIQFRSVFGSLDYKDPSTCSSLLHLMVSEKHDTKQCLYAISTLLFAGLDPNSKDANGYNFIQIALFSGYDESFIERIIKGACSCGLDVNIVDKYLATIIHTAVFSEEYKGDILNIYKFLVDNGFDSTAVNIDNVSIYDAVLKSAKYSKEQKENFIKEFNKNKDKNLNTATVVPIDSEKKIVKKKVESENNKVKSEPEKNEKKQKFSLSAMQEIEKYGVLLNEKEFSNPPTIGREKEIKNLLICLASETKSPILVGESGVGKTAIIYELVYRIKNGLVPKFLENQNILAVTAGELVAGAQYVGMFEQRVKDLIRICKKYDLLLFIDEIHEIYGTGASSKSPLDMAAMIKHYLDRGDVRIIGTTTEQEYSQYFSSDALKRRFEKVVVKEPTDEVLYQIVEKVIDDLCKKNKITFRSEDIKNKMIDVIIELTNKNHRDYKDVLCNPDLVISIIDRAFAIAKVEDSDYIEVEHFIESISYCDRLYPYATTRAINNLTSEKKEEKEEKENNKIYLLKFDEKR